MNKAIATALTAGFLLCSAAHARAAAVPDEVGQNALVFVYVHGFGESKEVVPFEECMRGFLKRLPLKAAVFTHRWDRVKIDVTKVVAQWTQAKRKADEAAGPFMTDVLQRLEAERVPYVVVAYSLGTRVVAESLKQGNSRLQYLRGMYFLGSALPRSYRLHTAALPEGMKIVSYYSDFLDDVLKVSFFTAEGVKAGGETGFDDASAFQNFRTVCTHIHKPGPLQRDYSNLAPAIGYLSFFKENTFLAGEPSGVNEESTVGAGTLHWNDLARFDAPGGPLLLQQNVNTLHYRVVTAGDDGKRVRKAWGANPHSLLLDLHLFPAPYARIVRQRDP